jgi:hypothetical protein
VLDSIFLLLAVTALVGCTTTTVIYPSTTDVESVSLPAANELLVAACAPLTQASVLPTYGGQQCGFWLIDPLMQQMTMLAQLEAVASNENAVYWLAEGSRFLFQQRAVASVTNYHNPFAFFDGHGFSVKMADLSGGVVVSPDGQYFVSLTCRTANLNPGSRFV